MFASPTARLRLWLVALACLPAVWTGSAIGAAPPCAGLTDGVAQAAPATGQPCWVEVAPYPFGSDGDPVTDPNAPVCTQAQNARSACYLVATSMAFRAWNRGIAAVRNGDRGGSTPFGVWVYNGARWFPDPTFPGTGVCRGDTVLWAGKLDYWLVGGDGWANPCRFDGDAQAWQTVRIPSTTVARTGAQLASLLTARLPGALTGGTCDAWDSCWFFGTYGTILRWNGTSLQDVSPDPGQVTPLVSTPGQRPSLTGFRAARTIRDAGHRTIVLAVGSTDGYLGALRPRDGGGPPPQVWRADAGEWRGLGWTPPTSPLAGDPFRTDLVAITMGADGHGWVAGNRSARGVPTGAAGASGPSPLVPITPDGPDATCAGPSPDRFGLGAATPSADSFAWTSLSQRPAGGALAGALVRPLSDSQPVSRNHDGAPEPAIVTVSCSGAATVTRFGVPDPTEPAPQPIVAANRDSSTFAVVQTAPNAGWAATDFGLLKEPGNTGFIRYQPPRLYQYTDLSSAAAPPGDDVEPRPIVTQEDVTTFVVLPPDPLPPPPPPQRSRVVPQKPAIYAITSRVSGNTVEVRFKVRRRVMLGLAAERRGRVVASTGLKVFLRGDARLALSLDPRNWPDKITFLTDTPTVTVRSPGKQVRGTVVLRAQAKAITGRKITQVRFEYTRATKREDWIVIGTDLTRPFTAKFDTRLVANGRYRFRAIAVDNRRQSGLSPEVAPSLIRNPKST